MQQTILGHSDRGVEQYTIPPRLLCFLRPAITFAALAPSYRGICSLPCWPSQPDPPSPILYLPGHLHPVQHFATTSSFTMKLGPTPERQKQGLGAGGSGGNASARKGGRAGLLLNTLGDFPTRSHNPSSSQLQAHAAAPLQRQLTFILTSGVLLSECVGRCRLQLKF